jgi:uncharacterized membrane protein
MTPSPRIWFATFAALVFVIGGLAGVVVDRQWLLPRGAGAPPVQGLGQGPGRGMGPGGGLGIGRGGGPLLQGPDRVIADLDGALKLTADQKDAIRKILDDWRPRVQALQDTAREEFVSAQAKLHADIAGTLTPEQAKRFEALSAPLLEGGRGPRGGGMGRGRGR